MAYREMCPICGQKMPHYFDVAKALESAMPMVSEGLRPLLYQAKWQLEQYQRKLGRVAGERHEEMDGH